MFKHTFQLVPENTISWSDAMRAYAAALGEEKLNRLIVYCQDEETGELVKTQGNHILTPEIGAEQGAFLEALVVKFLDALRAGEMTAKVIVSPDQPPSALPTVLWEYPQAELILLKGQIDGDPFEWGLPDRTAIFIDRPEFEAWLNDRISLEQTTGATDEAETIPTQAADDKVDNSLEEIPEPFPAPARQTGTLRPATIARRKAAYDLVEHYKPEFTDLDGRVNLEKTYMRAARLSGGEWKADALGRAYRYHVQYLSRQVGNFKK